MLGMGLGIRMRMGRKKIKRLEMINNRTNKRKINKRRRKSLKESRRKDEDKCIIIKFKNGSIFFCNIIFINKLILLFFYFNLITLN
jgi:hypothetical protein